MITIGPPSSRHAASRPPTDESGSIAMALLFTLVGVSLTTFIAPMLINQIKSTGTANARVHALHAAQSGIDVAVGRIRAAKDPSTELGDPSRLPCGPLSGPVGDGSSATYSVTIEYAADDPQGAWTVPHPLDCPSLATPAAYAVLKATGTDGLVTRTLRSTYRFHSTWPNIPGGLIRQFMDQSLCLDAGSATPAAGAEVRLRACVDASPQQLFGYYPDLSIVLLSSKTETQPDGLCLNAGVIQVTDNPVTLRPCSRTAPGHQRWGLDDWSMFTGTADDLTATGLCINTTDAGTPDIPLIMAPCNKDTLLRHSFAPDAEVGAGAAGLPNENAHGTWHQLVNFKQFGRCLDVSFFIPSYSYMVTWPCKQGAGDVGWNQKWYLPSSTAPGPIKINDPGDSTFYCLQPPVGGAIGGYVTLLPCAASTDTGRWTVVGDSTGVWDTDYRIIDSYGHCLAAKDNSLADFMRNPTGELTGYQVSKVITVACTSDPLQKWNAPPRAEPPALADIAEQ